MKTFKQFLFESEPQELEEFISEHCKDLVRHLDNEVHNSIHVPIYRGMNPGSNSAAISLTYKGNEITGYIKNVRDARIPRDTHPDLSNVVDDLFNKEFGWKARSQGLFCTGNQHEAVEYGDVYQIFPIGNLKFLWSKDVKDLITSINQTLSNANLRDKPVHKPHDSETLTKFKTAIEPLVKHYTNKDLWAGIESMNEIMINCKTYLAIHVQEIR